MHDVRPILRRRFWIFTALACMGAVLAIFFGYSFFHMPEARQIFGGKEMEMGLVPWYHPAVFWLDWFASWVAHTFDVTDPAALSSAVLTTIQIGFGLGFACCEAGVLLAGREWFVKRQRDRLSTEAGARKRPWYFVFYMAFMAVLNIVGWLVMIGLILIAMFTMPAAAFAMGVFALGTGFFLVYSMYGLWRWKRWGFWGLFWAYLVSLGAGLIAGPGVPEVSTLIALLLLLLVVFAGGEHAVWKQLE